MTKTPRRLGLDRDRKASHDLIRLLDKPGSEVRISIEIAFRSSPRRRAFDDGKPSFATDSRVTVTNPESTRRQVIAPIGRKLLIALIAETPGFRNVKRD